MRGSIYPVELERIEGTTVETPRVRKLSKDERGGRKP
jgi:hypothetical protein